MYRTILAAALLLASSLAAAGQTLRVGISGDPDILDPTLGSSYYGRIVYAAMCDRLFDLDANLTIVPQLATGYRYETPTQLVISLRDGVLFQDGEPFDAEAVKYKLERDLTMPGSRNAIELTAIQSIDVVDRLTVRLNLKAPAAQLLVQLTDRAGVMISPKAAKAAGASFGVAPVCAGPFAFESRVAQDRIVLKRFPQYWNAGQIHFDRVVYEPLPNPTTRLANLRAGALDIVDNITPTDIAVVRRDPNLKLAIGDGLSYTAIAVNTDNGPRSRTPIGRDKLVRQAFEAAIDRQALVDVVYSGMHIPVAQANTPSSPYYIADIAPPPRDLARAKALLRQAGVALPIAVQMTVPNNADLQQAAEVIQSMVQEAGFAVTIRAMEFTSSVAAARAGDFQAYMIFWGGRSDPDGNMWQMLHSGGLFNYSKFADPGMDALLDDARKVSDIPDRRAIYTKVWRQERDDLPLIYLWISRNVVGMQKGVTGFVQVPDGLIRLDGVSLR